MIAIDSDTKKEIDFLYITVMDMLWDVEWPFCSIRRHQYMLFITEKYDHIHDRMVKTKCILNI